MATTVNKTLQALRVNDPVITQVVHGYMQANSIAPFVAPVVTVEARGGKIIRFGRENLVLENTKRAPGTRIGRVHTSFSNDQFSLLQYARSGAVTAEEYEEAINGDAQIDLRTKAALRAAQAIEQDWENDVISAITNASLYETSCTEALAGTAKFSDSSSDPEVTVQSWREAVRSQIGVYPNSAVISTDVYNALKFHPIFRDRIKYTSNASVTLDMIANFFELERGIRVAQRVKVDPLTNQFVDMMPDGLFVLFYSPQDATNSTDYGTVFTPSDGADRARPSFAYTYQLRGYPIGAVERFDEDERVFLTDIIAEQQIVLTMQGATDKVGGGFLGTAVV